jgi:hypothetical protein
MLILVSLTLNRIKDSSPTDFLESHPFCFGKGGNNSILLIKGEKENDISQNISGSENAGGFLSASEGLSL